MEDEINRLQSEIGAANGKRNRILMSNCESVVVGLAVAVLDTETDEKKKRLGKLTKQRDALLLNPRKSRWDVLNECLETSVKYSHCNDEVSAPHAAATYDDVKRAFEPITQHITQGVKAIPAEDLELLVQVLGRTSTSIGEIITGKEATKRLYLIFPILAIVSSLFNGDVQIKVEEEVTGKNVNATGYFEFMLVRGDKRVCIVEAKKDRMEQGLADCLIGCEVVADAHNLQTVHGIVTSFISWTFLKSCDDRIERSDTTLAYCQGKAQPESLMRIAGKIYAILSDD